MGVHLHALKGLFILLWFSIAIADVVADAIVVEKSEGKSQEIATNLQVCSPFLNRFLTNRFFTINSIFYCCLHTIISASLGELER